MFAGLRSCGGGFVVKSHRAGMCYGSCMNTDHFVATLKLAQEARGAAQRRRKRNAELRELASASTIVFTGLLLAVLYALLTHQIPI